MGCLPVGPGTHASESFLDMKKTPRKYNSLTYDKSPRKKKALQSTKKWIRCLDTVNSARSDKSTIRRTGF